ncbi:hypothetical protein JYU20_00020 [Bacteroidales bacterium AH-315-I05]|nr:hypothetical protein [Bacteroidales bacterium AH-315-I05]
MEDTFKKLLYAGVGLAADATEKIEKEVNKLVEKGKTSDSEAKKVIDDFIAKTEEQTGEFENKFNEIIEKFGYAKNTEVAELRKKLEILETKAAKTATATAAPKVATAKA